jgi:hypothetical protein
MAWNFIYGVYLMFSYFIRFKKTRDENPSLFMISTYFLKNEIKDRGVVYDEHYTIL